MALLAMMVRDEVLPLKDDEGLTEKLVGEQGVKVLNELIAPYLPQVVQRVVSADYLTNYVDHYELAKSRVQIRVSTAVSSPAPEDSIDASVHQDDECHPEVPLRSPDSSHDQDSQVEALAADAAS